jgi:hypothetical protein
MLTRIGWVAALSLLLGIGLSSQAQASADIVFETITDDAFIGRSGGADGFVGTADDGVDFSNVLGAVSWGVSPPGFVTYIAPLTLTLPDPLVFEDGSSTITDFSADGLTTCPPVSSISSPSTTCPR